MGNHEVTKRQPLLNAQGSIAEPGWAKSQIWDYDRSQVMRVNHFPVRFL